MSGTGPFRPFAAAQQHVRSWWWSRRAKSTPQPTRLDPTRRFHASLQRFIWLGLYDKLGVEV